MRKLKEIILKFIFTNEHKSYELFRIHDTDFYLIKEC